MKKEKRRIPIAVQVAIVTALTAIVVAAINAIVNAQAVRSELEPTIIAQGTRIAELTNTIPMPQVITQIVELQVTPTATSIPTPVPHLIDEMEKISDWSPSSCKDTCESAALYGNSVILVSLAQGRTDNALEIVFDLKNKGWVGITRRVDTQLLLGTKGITFHYKGTGAPNTIELKLLLRYPGDPDDTTFGASWKRATDTNESWVSAEALYDRDFTCWWPVDLCEKHDKALNLNYVQRIDFAISNKSDDDTVGLGKVAFDDLAGIGIQP